MADWLSESDRYGDRIEIVAYVSAVASFAALVVYFGMLFFAESVRIRPADEKLVILLFLAVSGTAGLLTAAHRNGGRRLLLVCLMLAGLTGMLRSLQNQSWGYAPLALFAVYGHWILTCPAAVERFRPLKPHERKTGEGAGVYYLLLSVFVFYAAYRLMLALQILGVQEYDPRYDPVGGVLQLFASGLYLLLAAGLRRWRPWARWSGVFLFALIGLAMAPELVNVTRYWVYWRQLLKLFYFFAFAAYLLLSPVARRGFSRPPKPEAARTPHDPSPPS